MSLATPQATLPSGVAGSDGPLHRVPLQGRESGSARRGGPRGDLDARHVPRVARCLHRGERCSALDNGIEHGVWARRLEAMLPVDPRRRYPLGTGGTRAGPPKAPGHAVRHAGRDPHRRGPARAPGACLGGPGGPGSPHVGPHARRRESHPQRPASARRATATDGGPGDATARSPGRPRAAESGGAYDAAPDGLRHHPRPRPAPLPVPRSIAPSNPARTFRALAGLRPAPRTPERRLLETPGAAVGSSGSPAQRLPEVRPIDAALAPCTSREPVFTVAERVEQELGGRRGRSASAVPQGGAACRSPRGPSPWAAMGARAGPHRSQGGLRSSPGRASWPSREGGRPRPPSPAQALPSPRPRSRTPNGGSSRGSSRTATSSASRAPFSALAATRGARASAP
jgi:hypothetical protein